MLFLEMNGNDDSNNGGGGKDSYKVLLWYDEIYRYEQCETVKKQRWNRCFRQKLPYPAIFFYNFSPN